MVISLAIRGSLPQVPLGAKGADYPVVTKTDSTPSTNSSNGSSAPVPAADRITSAEISEIRRYEAVANASRSFFRDVYAVSDTSFTIFKDSSGQFITRYTSLRDGRVTYIPEQNILQYAQSRILGGGSLLQIRV